MPSIASERNSQIERIITQIASMHREELVRTLRGMHCDFHMDFTDEFLDAMSLERLRHIVLAASLHDHAEPAKNN